MYEAFLDAALYAVHYIIKQSLPGLNLLNLGGDGGERFLVGGVYVRRAQDWLIANKHLSTEMAGSNVNFNKIVTKLASLDVRALALLRFRIPKLVVPLACVVNYYGIVFEAQSPIAYT